METFSMDDLAMFVGSAVYQKVKTYWPEKDTRFWDRKTKELLKRYLAENGERWTLAALMEVGPN